VSRAQLPAEILAHCPTLGQPIDELRKNQAALAEWINRLFADLERRRKQLDREVETLHAQRTQLSQQVSASSPAENGLAAELQLRLEQVEADLAAARDELNDSRERLAAALAAQSQVVELPAAGPDLAPRVKALEDERAELLRNLDTARAQIGQLAGAALELAEARAQLARLREEVLTARTQAKEGAHASDAGRQQQICDLELERRALKAELDSVRRHAAELADHLAETRRQFVEERSEWNAELRHLRRLLERQSQLLEDRAAFGMYNNGARRSNVSEPVGPVHDSVLEAVMAQYAPLQHDRPVRQAGSRPPLDTNEG
jgi:chromosome segregation ATPase